MFKLNGREYEAKEFDFKLFCKLEEYGITLQNSGEKTFSLLRVYVAHCTNTSVDKANDAIEKHLIANGADAFSDMFTLIAQKLQDSQLLQVLKAKEGEAETE